MACNASALAAAAPPGAITPERVIRHNRKSEGAVRGDRHRLLSKRVLYHLLKTQDFCKAKITYLSDEILGYIVLFSICNKNLTPDSARAITMDRLQKLKNAISDASRCFWPEPDGWHIT